MHKPQNDWNLNQWLNYLENRNTQEIQLGLSRIKEVAKKLKVQTPECKIITVAGTNGKGSTVTALETIYHTAGYRVGAYTSPHLINFNERIRVNLEPISDEDLCQAFYVIENIREDILLTYFEVTTLAALWFFKNSHLDIIILEVGLGGRLDATNIINSDLAIITTIDFDHQEFLGNTLEAIGYEKAGILRKNKVFIYADSNPPVSIINEANRLNVLPILYGKDYSFIDHGNDWDIQGFGRQITALPKPKIQLKAAAAAIIACQFLQNTEVEKVKSVDETKKYAPSQLYVSTEHIISALQSMFIAGRLQLIKDKISILYDVSHNPQSVRLLSQTLQRYDKNARVFAVFSALKDKDILEMIIPLKDCVTRWFPAQLEGKRAAHADLLLSKFSDAEIFVENCYNSPFAAFQAALNQAEAGDLIVVYGSFLTVSQVMANRNLILS